MNNLLLALLLTLSFSTAASEVNTETSKCDSYIEYFDEDTSKIKRVYVDCVTDVTNDQDYVNDDGDSTISWDFDDSEK